MAFITHCWKSARIDLPLLLLAVCLTGTYPGVGWAQSTGAVISALKFERAGEDILLSANVKLDLPMVVEDALLKGIPMIFAARVKILRERWYWRNQLLVNAERHMRLAYQPLTRRWRLNVVSGAVSQGALGLSLSQHFESLAEALTTVKTLSRWKIADASEFDPEQRYLVEFHFALDLSQLPRPFQIGLLGQSDWNVSASVNQPLEVVVAK